LVEETRVLGENHRPTSSHWQTLSYNDVSSTLRLSRIQTHNVSGAKLVKVKGTSYTTIIKLMSTF
jgi:hypothetical protein